MKSSVFAVLFFVCIGMCAGCGGGGGPVVPETPESKPADVAPSGIESPPPVGTTSK